MFGINLGKSQEQRFAINQLASGQKIGPWRPIPRDNVRAHEIPGHPSETIAFEKYFGLLDQVDDHVEMFVIGRYLYIASQGPDTIDDAEKDVFSYRAYKVPLDAVQSILVKKEED